MFEPSDIIGNFKIIRELGRGGMAIVYEAEDLSLHRRVAMKILLPEYTQDKDVVERFRREAVLASNLEHPHIVPIYNIGNEKRYWYITMRLIEGETLKAKLLREGRLPVNDIPHLLFPVASALDYAHTKGVIHRDVKASNIFISKTNQIYLGDFGIAKARDAIQMTSSGLVMGTPEYMSPEQAQGKPCDYRSDIYSLGVVLYETLTGRPPFKADTPVATALKHVKDEPTLLEDWPAELKQLFEKCLAKNPDKRYLSASAVIKDFVHVMGLQEIPFPTQVRDNKNNENKKRELAWLRTVGIPIGIFLVLVILVLLVTPSGRHVQVIDSSGGIGQPRSISQPSSPSLGENDRMQLSNPTLISPQSTQSASIQKAEEENKQSDLEPTVPLKEGEIVARSLHTGLSLKIEVDAPLDEKSQMCGFILHETIPELGKVERSVNEEGLGILTIGGLPITKQLLIQHAVRKINKLPSTIPFPQQGDFVIVVLGRTVDRLTDQEFRDLFKTYWGFKRVYVDSMAVAGAKGYLDIANGRIALIGFDEEDFR